MESLSCSLDLRSFQGLLNALAKRRFYGEATITNDFLIEQLYSSVDLEKSVALNEINIFNEVTQLRLLRNNVINCLCLEGFGESC
jgi:hypothetical protein